jgi:hypothetical protein
LAYHLDKARNTGSTDVLVGVVQTAGKLRVRVGPDQFRRPSANPGLGSEGPVGPDAALWLRQLRHKP